MIICSKHEGNGTYREFMLDDAEMGDRTPVKTHVAQRANGEVIAEDDWREAGVITRAQNGVEAAVLRSVRRGRNSDFVKLNQVFPNEVAALQAIAKHYVPATTLQN